MSDLPVPSEHEIARAAFLIWLEAGRPDGLAEDHWHRARDMLAARAPQIAAEAEAEAEAEVTTKARRRRKPKPADPA